MIIRATFLCSCLLSIACGPGPGDTTDTAATTGASTSSGGSSTGATTGSSGTSADTTPTTGGMTGTTGDTGTTTAATTTAATSGTTDAPSGTTGAPICEDIVGSQDCEALVEVATELSFETCIQCQGVPCGVDAECDNAFPCVDEAIVIQGCCSDRQCAGLSLYCGMFIATNNVCVNDDDA